MTEQTAPQTVSLTWHSGKGVPARKCLACGHVNEMTCVVSTSHVVRARGDVLFSLCPDCSSLNAEGEFSDFLTSDDGFIGETNAKYVWDHYLQVGAGIDFMARPLEQVGIVNGGRLLDVGCGYGFPLDYWREVAHGEAIGLEPSDYGARGSAELNVRIIPQYLSDAEELVGQKFDRIISSEVIEHVPDPKGFLEEIRHYLADSGIVILTTPNAGFVVPGNPLSMMIAALSPGLHQILFSARALEALLQEVGFTHYRVDVAGERLIAYAANVPISISDNNVRIRQNYLDYLRARIPSTKPEDALGSGLRYRLFKELVNDGLFEEALPLGISIASTIKNHYGFDPLVPDDCRSAVLSCDTLQSYAIAAPFFLPCFVYYAAMMIRRGNPMGNSTAADMFACAAELCASAQRHHVIFSQESGSLYWIAVYEEGFARLVDGDKEAAFRLMDRVRHGSAPEEEYLAFCLRPTSLILRATLQSGVAKLQIGEPEVAMSIFRETLAAITEGSEKHIAEEATSLWKIASEQSKTMLPEWVFGSEQGRSDREIAERKKTLFQAVISRGTRLKSQ